MSLPEELYLAMVVFLFGSFGALLAILSWLDAKDEKIKDRREHARASTRPQTAGISRHAGAHN